MTRYAVAHHPDARIIEDSIVNGKCVCPGGLGRPDLLAFRDDEARQAYLDTHGVIFNGYG